MLEFFKRMPIAEEMIRRNPLYYYRYRRLLQQSVGFDRAARHRLQTKLQDRVLSWAGSIPGYHAHEAKRALGDFPILTKEVLQQRAGEFHAGNPLAGVSAATGGSSGRPLRLVRSPASVAAEQATIDWLASNAGVDLMRARVAVLRGDSFKDPDDQAAPFWRYFGSRRLVLSSSHLGRANFPAFDAELRKFKPDVLLAYPSSLDLLIGLIEENGSTLPVKLVLSSSETLRPGLRARTKATLGAMLIDHYGMAERVAAAYSIADGAYWFVFPYGATELIPVEEDPDNAAGGSESGDEFRIVGSGFWNRAQPLIRYDSGDIALVKPGADAAQLDRITLGLEPFLGIAGRASDVLQLANGGRVFAMDQVPRGVTGVATVQFVQEAYDMVRIVVVPANGFSEATTAMIRRNFYLKAPKSVRLEFETRDTPFRLPNGKAPIFVSQIDRA